MMRPCGSSAERVAGTRPMMRRCRSSAQRVAGRRNTIRLGLEQRLTEARGPGGTWAAPLRIRAVSSSLFSGGVRVRRRGLIWAGGPRAGQEGIEISTASEPQGMAVFVRERAGGACTRCHSIHRSRPAGRPPAVPPALPDPPAVGGSSQLRLRTEGTSCTCIRMLRGIICVAALL